MSNARGHEEHLWFLNTYVIARVRHDDGADGIVGPPLHDSRGIDGL